MKSMATCSIPPSLPPPRCKLDETQPLPLRGVREKSKQARVEEFRLLCFIASETLLYDDLVNRKAKNRFPSFQGYETYDAYSSRYERRTRESVASLALPCFPRLASSRTIHRDPVINVHGNSHVTRETCIKELRIRALNTEDFVFNVLLSIRANVRRMLEMDDSHKCVST